MLKKMAPYIVGGIFSILILVIGFYAGSSYFNSITNRSFLKNDIYGALESMPVLNYLDAGESEKAREVLLLKQDMAILTINALTKPGDKSFIDGCKILKRISKKRKDNPAKYSNYNYGTSDQKSEEIKCEVKNILDKWDTVSCGEEFK